MVKVWKFAGGYSWIATGNGKAKRGHADTAAAARSQAERAAGGKGGKSKPAGKRKARRSSGVLAKVRKAFL